VAAVMAAGAVYASSVSSYSTPQLVSEINTVITSVEGRLDGIEGGTKLPLLASGKIIVGNAGGTGEARTVTGDITLSNEGVAAIGSGVIVNADISATAAIAHTKLAAVAPGYLLVGNASSQAVAVAVSGDITMGNDGAVAIAPGVIVAADINADAAIAATQLSSGVQTSLGKADAAAPAVAVAGAPAVAGSVATVTNTVTITAKDVAGATLAQRRLVRVWMAETAYGVPSTNNIESVTLSGGTAIQTVTAAADYIYLTADTGIASAEIVGSAAGTNYVMVADGGYVTSAAVVFESGE
jgi:hypothetical protein